MKHGFFILEEKSCINKKKLFKYLADKIFKEKLCIYYDYEKCGKFKDGYAVQQHMCDKGHCFMNQDYFEEYERFYDFSAENEAMAKKLQEKFKDAQGGEEFLYEVPENEKNSESEEEESEEWSDCDDDSNSVEMTEEKPKKNAKK